LVCHCLILSLAILFLWSNASTFINKWAFGIPNVQMKLNLFWNGACSDCHEPILEQSLLWLPWWAKFYKFSNLRRCWFSGPHQTSLRWKSLRMWLLMLHCNWDMRSTGALLPWGRLDMAVIWRNS
jgi:hypothetical protein